MGRLFGLYWPGWNHTLRLLDPASAPTLPRQGSFTCVLVSRTARWIATAVACGLIFCVVRNYDRISRLFLLELHDQHDTGFGPTTLPSLSPNNIDWSRFAYIQYVTNSEYLCNSVMIFETLHRLGSPADRVMMYPAYMFDPFGMDAETDDARLITKARDDYDVKLVPITVQHREVHDPTWADSYTKLLAFNATQYDRVLSLDSDSLILQPMDELFLLPSCPVAMPRAYWLYPKKKVLASQLMLLQPSAVEFERVSEKMGSAGANDYDMDILNDIYGESALVLPHRGYGLLTSEFRRHDHGAYLGSDKETWNPVTAYNEAKFVHFSDWPLPKPWLPAPGAVLLAQRPGCQEMEGVVDCADRDVWRGIYTEFQSLRQRVCKTGRSS